MSTFYLQLTEDNIITDVIEYPVEGYVQVEITQVLPAGINAGWYRWIDGDYVLDEDRKSEDVSQLIIQAKQDAQDELLLELINGGLI